MAGRSPHRPPPSSVRFAVTFAERARRRAGQARIVRLVNYEWDFDGAALCCVVSHVHHEWDFCMPEWPCFGIWVAVVNLCGSYSKKHAAEDALPRIGGPGIGVRLSANMGERGSAAGSMGRHSNRLADGQASLNNGGLGGTSRGENNCNSMMMNKATQSQSA